jgi:inhibitor of the pro-sigma K processing machinery
MNILTFVIAIAVLVVVLKIISLPFKIIIKFIINSVIGGIILYVLAFFGIIVALNWWIVILTGLLGVPGLVIGIIITFLL